MKIGQRENYEGLIIERGAAGFWIIDWDYEGERVLNSGNPIRTLHDARAWVLSRT